MSPAFLSMQDDNWRQILNLAEQKHRSCQVPSYLYSIISHKVYEMSGNLEDYSKGDMPVAKIYQPLRQRIYGVLFHEKPTVTGVKEWCVESSTVPSEPTDVPVVRIRSVGKLIAEQWRTKGGGVFKLPSKFRRPYKKSCQTQSDCENC